MWACTHPASAWNIFSSTLSGLVPTIPRNVCMDKPFKCIKHIQFDIVWIIPNNDRKSGKHTHRGCLKDILFTTVGNAPNNNIKIGYAHTLVWQRTFILHYCWDWFQQCQEMFISSTPPTIVLIILGPTLWGLVPTTTLNMIFTCRELIYYSYWCSWLHVHAISVCHKLQSELIFVMHPQNKDAISCTTRSAHSALMGLL